jgi:hypothetical protein
MLAASLSIPQLALAEDEAKQLAKAVHNVQQYYPMHISAKSMAWANLIMIGGTVYGSRGVAIWAEMRMKEEERAKNAPTVVNFTPR